MNESIDNPIRRQEILKRLIRDLHAGHPVEEVKEEFAAVLGNATAGEIAEMEQALISEGLPETDIKMLCDVHLSVFRESLEGQTKTESVPGHPIFTFRAENLAVGHILEALGRTLESWLAAPDETTLNEARRQSEKLLQYEKHYQRKENLLFPYLERHNFYGPSSVMWAIHDDIRRDWKTLANLLTTGEISTEARELYQRLDKTIRDMIYKEDHILFPAAMERLSPEEWGKLRHQESEIGYCYVLPGKAWQPPTVQSPDSPVMPAAEGTLSLEVGSLTVEQLNMMFGALPMDLTYVDEEDRVRFFTQTRDRIFPRTPAVIGRQVQKCHPPQSVHRVQQILDDFRAGRREVAEFWIQMAGKFISIRYFPLRDVTGAYRGTLEVVQDLTALRALQGERRLLDETAPSLPENSTRE